MKKLLSLVLTAVILISFVNIANANSVAFKNSEKKEIETRYLKGNLAEAAIRAKLAAEGANSNTIDLLINKLRNGEMWDSFKAEYKNLKPQIDTPTYKKTIYPDGSMIIAGSKQNKSFKVLANQDLHYENDVQIYKNTIVINV